MINLHHSSIKDADVAIGHSQGYTMQGPEMGWKGWTPGNNTHKKKLSLRKHVFVVIETSVKDIMQGRTISPYLLESLMSF